MLKRISLFSGLFITIFLLITPEWVTATPLTGCLKHKGNLYRVNPGTEPVKPCKGKDTQVTWGDGGGAQFVLKDNSGNPFGTVVTVGIDTQSMPFEGDLFVDPRRVLTRVNFLNGVGAMVPVAIRVFPTQIMFHHRVLYLTADCTGDGFMHQNLRGSGFGPAFAASAIVGEAGEAGERSLYVAVAEPPVERDFNSVSAGGVCIVFGGPLTRLSVPAEELDPDLHTTFPPNYTLDTP